MSPLNVKSMIPFALYSGFSSVSCKTFRFTMLMASSFPFLRSAATATNQQGFHLNRTLLQPHPSSPSSSHGSDLNTPEPHTTLLILKLCLIVIERIICGIMSEYVLTFAVKFRSRTLHLLLAAAAPLESTRERERKREALSQADDMKRYDMILVAKKIPCFRLQLTSCESV